MTDKVSTTIDGQTAEVDRSYWGYGGNASQLLICQETVEGGGVCQPVPKIKIWIWFDWIWPWKFWI